MLHCHVDRCVDAVLQLSHQRIASTLYLELDNDGTVESIKRKTNPAAFLKMVASFVTASVIKREEENQRLLVAVTVERNKTDPYMARVSFGSRRRLRNGGYGNPGSGE